jgi:hypothetical protein
MGGRRAFSGPPFSGRIRINPAIRARFTLDNPVASFTFVDDIVTASTVESAALLRHKAALCTALDGLTNHVNLLFDGSVFILKKPTRFQNQIHGQVGSVIPFLKGALCYQK